VHLTIVDGVVPEYLAAARKNYDAPPTRPPRPRSPHQAGPFSSPDRIQSR
jgi:hypothetical protein